MRLLDSLFRPKFIGKYLADKLWRVILYFVLMFVLCATPSIVQYTNVGGVLYSDATELYQEIYNDSSISYKIEDNKLNSSNVGYYSDGGMAVAFNTKETKATLSLVFYEEYYVVVYEGGTSSEATLKTVYYNSLTDSSLDFSLVQQKSFAEVYKLLDLINVAYDAYKAHVVPTQLATALVSMLIEFGVVLLILIYTGQYFNPFLPRRIRGRIAVYAMSWTFVAYIVGALINFSYLFYLGVIISFIFMGIASRNIVRVKKTDIQQ